MEKKTCSKPPTSYEHGLMTTPQYGYTMVYYGILSIFWSWHIYYMEAGHSENYWSLKSKPLSFQVVPQQKYVLVTTATDALWTQPQAAWANQSCRETEHSWTPKKSLPLIKPLIRENQQRYGTPIVSNLLWKPWCHTFRCLLRIPCILYMHSFVPLHLPPLA